MAPGQAFSHTFEEAGEYLYYCGLHPNMVGTVIVQEGGTVSIATGDPLYGPGDTIEITGTITAFNGTTGQPILIRVTDPEGETDWVDQAPVASNGSFSYSFVTSALMNTYGTYTVIVAYRDAIGETTFQFGALDEEETVRKTFAVRLGDQSYPVQYSITGGRVVDIRADSETASMLVAIESTNYGRLVIELPMDLIDSEDGLGDADFIAFVDEMVAIPDEIETTNTARTLAIDFAPGSKEIEILGEAPLYPSSPSEWKTAYIVGKFLNSEPPKPDQIFKIQYRVMYGTMESFDIQQGIDGYLMHNTITIKVSSNDGVLEIKFPRNFPYANSGSGIGDFIFLVDDEDGSIEDSRITTDCFFVFSIPFSGSIEIGMPLSSILIKSPYRGDNIPDSCASQTLVENVPTKKDGTISPLQQFRAGVAAEDVPCPQTQEFMLMISPSGKPYCVDSSDVRFMTVRGWAAP